MTLLPLLLASTHSWAKIIDGEAQAIDGSVAADQYLLRNQASLIADGATTKEIRAESGSSLILNGSTVTSAGSSIGVELVNSSATINGSTVTGSRAGLSLGSLAAAPVGSRATVADSVITGGTTGIEVGAKGDLTLTRTVVTGISAVGSGVQLSTGNVSATASTIRGGAQGVLFLPGGVAGAPSRLALDGTRVEGQTGAAIVVNDFGLAPILATIEVNNGSTLVGGNGRILEIKGTSTANMTVDNSHLVGDVVAGAGATANITLQNQSTLTGRLENVNQLTVNSNARWVMVGDGSVENLALNGGGVQFGNPGEFFKLSVGSLSGEGGTFYMHTNFGQVDTLTVTGTATGNHSVSIDASGFEPVAAGAMPVVHIGGGDASFSLLGGPVDLGAFSYDLIKQGTNDWYLNTLTRTISPGTASVLALFNTAPTVWYGELTTLRSRMGEVRMDGGKAGGWVRAYGNKFDVDSGNGAAYQQTQHGLSFGADAPLPAGDGQWLVGLLGGYSKSDLNLTRGSSGTVDSYYLGAYTTWLDEPTGYYFDGVLKFNRFQNESDVHLSDGSKTKGSYDTNGVGASLEFGRHIKLADDYFVEPYTQLSGVVIQGQSYDLDNGLTADGELTSLKQGGNSTSFLRGDGVVLAEHQAGADPKSLMLVADQKNTLLSEVASGGASHVTFTPYGHPSAQQPVSAGLGYNGEFSEPQTGWQLLGNGYRAYNPRLMKFHSPDSFSPFGEGGVNAYTYCEGEPVLSADPDGHSAFGNFLRVLRPTTTQAVKKGVPTDLLKNNKDRAASVRPLGSKDVVRLEKMVRLRARQQEIVKWDVQQRSKDPVYVASYNEKHVDSDFVADMRGHLANADSDVNNARSLYDFARNNVGKLGITKESSMDIKIEALEYDVIVGAIRGKGAQEYYQYRQNQMFLANRTNANAGGKSKSNKRAHQAPGYR